MTSPSHKPAVPATKTPLPLHESPRETRTSTYEKDLIDGRVPPALAPVEVQTSLSAQKPVAQQESILDAITEVKRWDLVPGSVGSQVPENPMDDEDAEGRSETEQLAEEGVAEAEREQISLAAKAVRNGNRRPV